MRFGATDPLGIETGISMLSGAIEGGLVGSGALGPPPPPVIVPAKDYTPYLMGGIGVVLVIILLKKD